MSDLFADAGMREVRAALDVSAMRHDVIANNIANARTPGFRASDVSFARRVEGFRQDAPEVEAREDAAFNGVAFVDVHREMAAMSENAVRYQALMQMASGRLRGLQSIVHDGRRG